MLKNRKTIYMLIGIPIVLLICTIAWPLMVQIKRMERYLETTYGKPFTIESIVYFEEQLGSPITFKAVAHPNDRPDLKFDIGTKYDKTYYDYYLSTLMDSFVTKKVKRIINKDPIFVHVYLSSMKTPLKSYYKNGLLRIDKVLKDPNNQVELYIGYVTFKRKGNLGKLKYDIKNEIHNNNFSQTVKKLQKEKYAKVTLVIDYYDFKYRDKISQSHFWETGYHGKMKLFQVRFEDINQVNSSISLGDYTIY